MEQPINVKLMAWLMSRFAFAPGHNGSFINGTIAIIYVPGIVLDHTQKEMKWISGRIAIL
jgi:hypothetical protein